MKTIKEINTLREIKKTELDLRVNKNSSSAERHILVCMGTGCVSSKAPEIIKELTRVLKENNIQNVKVVKTGCFGLCAKGPIIIIRPDDTFYSLVKISDCEEIILSHIIENKIVERLLTKDLDGNAVNHLDGLSFYKKQKRIVLQNCGRINPECIDEYIAFDGYKALAKVFEEISPDSVIKEISSSGLRGRGGAGFPTGKKWEFTKQEKASQKYVVCNADEGDPGAFMDRSILEGDPHAIIEAMIIAGYAIGANKGYVYVRAEYPIAVQRLEIALKQAKEYGLLGDNIMKQGFAFDIEIALGAGAFVCGEETALLESLSGKRGEPTLKPPFPAVKGYLGKPTLINNVETLANVPQIILKGANWFNQIGTKNSKGTKVFALGGHVHNIGLVEVPMGTTLREIVFDIGGGIPNGKEFKAVQTGGPSGGCIPKELLDLAIDFDSLTKVESMMGSGGIIVMHEDDCMVDIAKFYLDFTVEESCGKCTPCRIGNLRLYEILDKITKGEGELTDLDKLNELSMAIKDTALCGLGQTSPNPVLSTLKFFHDEYVEHIKDKKCRAGKCTSMVCYEIDSEKCTGCTICKNNCPVNCIEGEIKVVHQIDQTKCIKCDNCYIKCPVKAVVKK